MSVYQGVTDAIDVAADRMMRSGIKDARITVDLTPKDFARFMAEAILRTDGAASAGATAPGKAIHRITYGGHVVRTGFAHGVLRAGR